MPLPNVAQPGHSALAARKAHQRLHANQARLARFPALFPWLQQLFQVRLGLRELAGHKGRDSGVPFQSVR